MQSVLTEKTKETEVRRGKCEETTMFENNKDNVLTYILQNNNSTKYRRKTQMKRKK